MNTKGGVCAATDGDEEEEKEDGDEEESGSPLIHKSRISNRYRSK